MKLKLHPEAARAHVRSGGERGVKAAADLLMAASRERVPVDSGRLRSSGSVQAQGLSARVAYNTPYAAAVHETQMKYLEEPMNDSGLRQEMMSVFVQELRIP